MRHTCLLNSIKNKKMKQNSGKLSVTAIMITLIVVFTLVYSIFKSSPKDSPQSFGHSDSHHSGEVLVTNSITLNSLVGNPMHNIQLSDKDGKVYTIADLKGKNVVLFFNEGLMCYPACWNQIAAFGSDARFNSEQIQAISVVVDSSTDWQRAISQMPQLAKATTMFDVGARASRELGALTTQSSMHKGSLPGHTYIVVDKNGIVKYVFDDPNMAIANDMLFSKITELSKE